MNAPTPIEMAFAMARTGRFDTFSQIKRALKRNFNVDRELQGRQLAADITRLCKAARSGTVDPSQSASRQG